MREREKVKRKMRYEIIDARKVRKSRRNPSQELRARAKRWTKRTKIENKKGGEEKKNHDESTLVNGILLCATTS